MVIDSHFSARSAALLTPSTVPNTDDPNIRHLLLSRWPVRVRAIRWGRRLQAAVCDAPLEPILHYSVQRVRRIGLFMFLGQLLFAFIWSIWLPQPWESIWLRIAVSTVGLPLIFYTKPLVFSEKSIQWVFSLAAWLQLPAFFSWMYLCNSANTVWLASMVAMVLIYYHSTDWRLATLGIASGALVAWIAFHWFGPTVPTIYGYQLKVDAVVIGFAWVAALGLGVSAANLRREHLQNTLATVGIMAHELRTPLATISLIGDALLGEAEEQTSAATHSPRIEKLAQRLQALVHSMNHQIDTQISNARLLGLPSSKERLHAGAVVREVIANYPYRSAKQRECVTLQIRQDFDFEFSPVLFSQVMDNLIKNALKSLVAADAPMQPGDLTIEVGTWQNRGCITVTDQGTGIDPHLQPRIFDAFFSTDRGTGHGLGLAFCKQAVREAHGSIRVQSEPGHGATFMVHLPILPSGVQKL